MEFFVFVGFAVILWLLWQRLQGLEDKLEQVQAAAFEFAPPEALAHAAQAEAVAEPVTPARPEPATPAPEWDPRELAVEGESWRERMAPMRLSFDFEDLFGRRLPIWAGGIALALAGIFLVRYSIEAGLITPPVRVAMSFVFGLVLLAGAEGAYRFEHRIADPRVRQALAGAGLATLYAGFYLAGTHYGLIGSAAAFLGLAAVTAAAIALSYRFGLPCAVLGLVGGFAAPALVASNEANVPVLTLYLALVTAGLSYTGRRQRRSWLGFAALAGAFVWGTLILLGQFGKSGDLVSFGLYLVLLGAAIPLLLGLDPANRLPRLIAAGLATLQMAAMVEKAGDGLLTWGLYLLLGAAFAALGWRDRALRDAGAIAGGLGVWLLFGWTAPSAGDYATVAAGFAAVFLLVPLTLLWLGRARQLDLWQISLLAPLLAAASYWQFGAWDTPGPEPVLAAATAALGLIAALAAARAWRDGDERLLWLPLASAALLAFAALLMMVDAWAAPLAGSAVTVCLLWLAWRRASGTLFGLGWAAAFVVLLTLLVTPNALMAELPRLFGEPGGRELLRALLRWAATALPFAALACLDARLAARRGAEALAALALYGLAAQIVPSEALAWTAAVGAILLALIWQRREMAGALWALAAVVVLWALDPLAVWLGAGAGALVGFPMLVAASLGLRDVLLHLGPPVAVTWIVWWRARPRNVRVAEWLLLAGLCASAIAAHTLYKQLFALGDQAQFVRLGMAERTLWEALLVVPALALLWRAPPPRAVIAARALLGAGLAHFAWFTLFLHNPLAVSQEVGPLPLANLLLPACALAWIALAALKRFLPPRVAWAAPAFDAAMMVVAAFFAFAELRQAFAGSRLTDGAVTQTEDLLRSLLGIVLAIAFLAWGSRTAQRSWRIGSLLLMLLAVAKVFVVDTAGLEGLLRIASFFALGASLIGIGWVYSRQLARRAPVAGPLPAA